MAEAGNSRTDSCLRTRQVAQTFNCEVGAARILLCLAKGVQSHRQKNDAAEHTGLRLFHVYNVRSAAFSD